MSENDKECFKENEKDCVKLFDRLTGDFRGTDLKNGISRSERKVYLGSSANPINVLNKSNITECFNDTHSENLCFTQCSTRISVCNF